jgi:hypothetical protein
MYAYKCNIVNLLIIFIQYYHGMISMSHSLDGNLFTYIFFEQELMCRVRQLESHVKQLQNIVIRKDVSTSQPVARQRKSKPQREIDFNKYDLYL